ncbi:MAG: hypothetical protein B7Z66_06660 [Chromatiales bacterium 21-64-14]|nr:MAG: hypothetical protein B7Z66_06660 [Chromatiales bacterium 21-64-14]HQU16538.1 MucB/RseB C-terminal domain-containing protein [Gammaproteobacteria bacterium]
MTCHSRSAPALIFVVFLFGSVPSAVAGAPATDALPSTPQGWVDRMSHALQTLNFEGTFVYLRDGHLETMRIVHVVEADGGERERVMALTGPAREIIRDDQEVTCILPDSKSIVVEKRRPHLPFPAAVPTGANQRDRYYEFRMLPRYRVTGRMAQAVAIIPKDRYRYGYRLYMDETTGLPLESVILDRAGRQVEQIQFTSLKVLQHADPRALVPDIDHDKGYTFHRQEGDDTVGIPGTSHWVVSSAPPGFVQTMYSRRILPGSSNPVEHLVFSDGLASVSVYVEKADGVKVLLHGASRMGAVNAYGRRVGAYQVTVVGEVPEATVSAIGQALRYDPNE